MRSVTLVRRLLGLSLLVLSQSVFAGENVWTTNGPPGEVIALSFDPATSILYAAAYLDGRSVAYRSPDHGATWTAVGEAPANASISTVAADPVHAGTVYAATFTSVANETDATVYRSPDAGATWLPLARFGDSTIYSIGVSPTEPSTLYAASSACHCDRIPCIDAIVCNRAVLRSDDFGTNWVRLEAGLAGWITHVASDPVAPNRLYATGDAGVFVSTDRGSQWTTSNAGLEACPSVLGFAVRSDGVLFSGTGQIVAHRFGCGGVFRSDDGSRTWSPTRLAPHYVTAVAVDPTDPETIYAAAARIGFFSPDGGVFRSSDGGNTWASFGAGLPAGGVTEFVVDSSGRKLYAATSEGVFDYEIVPGARPPVLPPRNRGTRTVPARP
jgi:hypothetical protein